jgi:hypothetical protein
MNSSNLRKNTRWIAVLACLSLATAAQGAVRYVSSFSGSDLVGGTSPTAPCKTIQRAVDSSASGDEIRIAKYDVQAGFPPTTNVCTYVGTNAAVVILPSGKSLTLNGGYIYIQTGGL